MAEQPGGRAESALSVLRSKTKLAEAVARGPLLNPTVIANPGHVCGKAAFALEIDHADGRLKANDLIKSI